MEKLRIAIIGVGSMGTKHIGNLSAYFKDDVDISGILCSSPQSTKDKASTSLETVKSNEAILIFSLINNK